MIVLSHIMRSLWEITQRNSEFIKVCNYTLHKNTLYKGDLPLTPMLPNMAPRELATKYIKYRANWRWGPHGEEHHLTGEEISSLYTRGVVWGRVGSPNDKIEEVSTWPYSGIKIDREWIHVVIRGRVQSVKYPIVKQCPYTHICCLPNPPPIFIIHHDIHIPRIFTTFWL